MGSDEEDIDTPRRGFGEALRNPMMSAEQWFARPRFTTTVRRALAPTNREAK